MTYRDNISTLVRLFDFLTTQYIVPLVPLIYCLLLWAEIQSHNHGLRF